MAVHPMLAQNFEDKIRRHILSGKVILRNKETRQGLGKAFGRWLFKTDS